MFLNGNKKSNVYPCKPHIIKMGFKGVNIIKACFRDDKLFSCSTQLSMKFVLLINLKILTFANSFLLNITEHENFSANKYENANYSWHFHIYWQRKLS